MSDTPAPQPLSEDAFRALCLRYHAGEIDEAGFAALCGELDVNADRRAVFVELAIQAEAVIEAFEHAAAEETAAELGIADDDEFSVMDMVVDQALAMRRKHDLEDEANRQLAAQQAEDARNLRFELRRNAAPEPVKRVIVIPKVVVWLGLVAVLGLVAWIGWPEAEAPTSSPPPVVERDEPAESDTPAAPVRVAQVVNTYDAEWSGLVSGGDLLAGQRVELAAGFAEVVFDDGARVVVQAPAAFESVDTGTLRLLYGKIAANVPPAAVGFRVLTPAMEVTDLSTAFAVLVDRAGAVQTHVLEGKVRAASRDNREDPIELSAGIAVAASRDGSLQQSDYDPVMFAKDWNEVVDAPVLSGQIQMATQMPPAGFDTNQAEAAHAHMYSVARGLSLDETITLHLGRPGVLDTTSRQQQDVVMTPDALPAGTQFDLYLVHFDPPGDGAGVLDEVQVHWELAFDRQIYGVYGEAQFPQGNSESLRGFQLSPNDLAGSGIIGAGDGDRLTISGDRRSLTGRLSARTGCDHFWVLVEHEPAP